jgi:Mg2+-importing ATPase
VLDVCAAHPDVDARVAEWSGQGIRVIAVAYRDLDEQPSYGRADERDLTLAGFVTFLDEPKPGVEKALADLASLGVDVKIITGDTKLVAQS